MIYTFDGNNVKVSPDDEWEDEKPQKPQEKKPSKRFSKKEAKAKNSFANEESSVSDLYAPIEPAPKPQNDFVTKSAGDYNYYTENSSANDESQTSMDDLAAQALAEVQGQSDSSNDYYADSDSQNTSYDVSDDEPDPAYQQSFFNAVNDISTDSSNANADSNQDYSQNEASSNDYSAEASQDYSVQNNAQDYSNQAYDYEQEYVNPSSQDGTDYSNADSKNTGYSNSVTQDTDYSNTNEESDYSNDTAVSDSDFYVAPSSNENSYYSDETEGDSDSQNTEYYSENDDYQEDAESSEGFDSADTDEVAPYNGSILNRSAEDNSLNSLDLEDTDQLLTQIDAFRKNAIELSGLMSRKQNEVRQLEEEVSRKEEQNKKLSQTLQKAQKESSVISAQLDSHVSEIKTSITQSMDSMKNEFMKSKAETDKNLIDQINNSTSGLSGLRNEIGQSIHSENVEQYRNIQQLINENNSNVELIDTLKKELKGVHSKLTIALLFSGLNFVGIIALFLHSLGIF